MKRLEPEIIDYYNTEVLKMISEKYGMKPMEALRAFVCSKTHEMLENAEMGMTEFGAGALFEIITQKIYDSYWEYHTERIENAFEDIDSLIATGKHAW